MVRELPRGFSHSILLDVDSRWRPTPSAPPPIASVEVKVGYDKPSRRATICKPLFFGGAAEPSATKYSASTSAAAAQAVSFPPPSRANDGPGYSCCGLLGPAFICGEEDEKENDSICFLRPYPVRLQRNKKRKCGTGTPPTTPWNLDMTIFRGGFFR